MTVGRTTVTYDAAVRAEASARGEQPLGDSPAHMRWKKIAVGTGTSAEADSGFDLPSTAIVHEVFVQVVTAESTGSTKTLAVGLLSSESGGDADGFLDGVSVASTGIVGGAFTYNDGTNQNSISAATYGVLLYSGLLGADVAGQAGTVNPKPHIAGSVTAKSVSYSRGSTFSEFSGYIWIRYSDFES